MNHNPLLPQIKAPSNRPINSATIETVLINVRTPTVLLTRNLI